ncbi:hypothetical protein P8A18_02675 [Streptomyces castrisilvae]|uniref:Uncharacterized protein n=1 Tax=Streptomyces castrisilvae TaxID=3033811 RepID=A0ABY9HD30_9ACTN|nr:hypothetical protein [Streptomyces sp. Mut1]WLQ32417.1 hypothetical protein P8A18_02675 [Streptomyces sp. Mut1]
MSVDLPTVNECWGWPEGGWLFPEAIAARPRFLCFLFFVLHAG